MDKNAKRRNRDTRSRERKKREREKEKERGRLREAEILLSQPLERAEKKRQGPRSVLPVRIPTGSLAIQPRTRREPGGREIKGSIFPSKREYPRRAESRRAGKWSQRRLYALPILRRNSIRSSFRGAKAPTKFLRKRKILMS